MQPQAVIALAEYSGPPPEGAVCGPIAPVGIESDMDTLADQVTRVRVYAGYSGWGEGQLDGELREEAWFVEPALPGDVFCADADRLWRHGGQVGGQLDQFRAGARGQGGSHPLVELVVVEPALGERGLQDLGGLVPVPVGHPDNRGPGGPGRPRSC